MQTPRLFVVTGIMAAGKSTVSQALAERFHRSVHLRGDLFRTAIVAGRDDMTPDPSDEAFAQLRLRYELAAVTADRYVAAGFTTVYQDNILGPMLGEVLELIQTRPLALIVLAPPVVEVARREESRDKTGYGDFSPTMLDQTLRQDTPRLGLWLDSSSLSPEETVEEILRRAPEEALIP
ncbi:MAG: phosphotransferase [bacterium]|nr:phosphotransferase [bacterium]MCP4967833.1 phosphotransferase [bacterium]